MKVILNASLCREAVVVPSHRIEDALAAHALEARDQVGLRVRKNMAHMQGAGDGGWRRVDGKALLPGGRLGVSIHTQLVPARLPGSLRRLGIKVLGQLRNVHEFNSVARANFPTQILNLSIPLA